MDILTEEQAAEILFEAELGELSKLDPHHMRAERVPGAPMLLTHSQPDEITVYSTSDGSPSTFPRYMMPKVMKFPNIEIPGKRRFDLRPTMPWKRGEVLCPLNPNHPDHAEVDAAGIYVTCGVATLKSPHDARQHMRLKHKQELAAIDAYKAELEKQEQREFQKAQMDAFRAMAHSGRSLEADTVPVAIPTDAVIVGNEKGWTPEKRQAFGEKMKAAKKAKEKEKATA